MMQDYGPNDQDSDGRLMEIHPPFSSTEPQISLRASLGDSDSHSVEKDTGQYDRDNAPSENEQELPDEKSSNNENIPPNISDGAADKAENFVEQIVSDDGKTAENPISIEAKLLDSTETRELSSKIVDPRNSVITDAFQHQNSICTSEQRRSWESLENNREESSIEDSCEPQRACSHDGNSSEKQSPTNSSYKQKLAVHKPSSLTEDSRLVKIPLPTGSMNIMQSNAQFLNKSRNFLNFITEKSTNIMEKTLLPQHIAVRYNSLMKLSESNSYPAEKKFPEETREESPAANLSSISEPDLISKSRMVTIYPGDEVTNGNSEDAGSIAKLETKRGSSSSDSHLSPSIIDVTCDSPLKDEANRETENSEMTESPLDIDENETEAANSPREDNNIPVDPGNTLLRHPVYLTLVRDYAKVRDERCKLADRVEKLEERNRMLEAQNSDELYAIQLEALEKTVERLTGELRSANSNQEDSAREYAAANKERESMVMKYAVSEKQLIDTQRAREFAERRYKETAKDHELLQNKLRQAQNERTRICNILDTKCRESADLQKDVERLKEDVNVRDAKLKWTQNKLKTEMEAQKETQQKLDKATARMNDMKEECEQIRRESQEMMRKFQHSEENKAVTLDQQLKEQQARLILERHVTEDKEMLRIQLQKEVDLLKNRQQALIEENNTLSLKIQDSEKERLVYESKMSDLKIIADQRQKEIVDLSAKVSHLETLKLQLIHKEQCLTSNEAEVERLRRVNQELQADMDCCRQREAHMLDFTQKLTDKNVRLQSEFTAVEAKAVQLEQEQGPLRQGIVEIRAKVKSLEESLAYEKNKRTEECEILARHLAEQTQLAQNLSQKLEDSQGEVAVLRRKQQISVKEMSRELQQCRKRLETYESASPSNSLDPTSRTASNSSLNTGETPNGVASDQSTTGENTLQSAELDRQSLIDRILKMQKINVRRAEKLDFLEEHSRTLVAELQKKTKIIQNYILHENFDAMGSNERDRHKAELARHGGIMASVYNHRVSDDNMTLELSLEINQKLQAVLEDALLKNITLKDNIDTLGEEIARLTIKNQQMLQQKGK